MMPLQAPAQCAHEWKCLRCGVEGHSLSTCTRPSKTKSGGQPKQVAKGKGRSSPTPTSSQPSSSAKPKAQPKKKGGKGGGKGKKDKPSVKSSAKSSAKAGEVSFDNDDVEEEDQEAECDWDEEEDHVAEEEHEDTFAERAFATAYHSHVCEVCESEEHDFASPMGYSATHGESQESAFVEEHWTTDEDAIDSAGPTRVPNSPVVPSEQALLCGPTFLA